MISLRMLPAMGQGGSEPSGVERVAALPGQEFHCHTGYLLAQCQEDILQLKRVLSHYPIERLGHWTWVLIRSQDWKPISRGVGMNPDTPAFTAVEPRETFLEEALFAHDPQRTSELMYLWHQWMPKLLELAVTHELGHAFCEVPNEAAADRFGAELRNGRPASCPVSKEARRRRVRAEEANG